MEVPGQQKRDLAERNLGLLSIFVKLSRANRVPIWQPLVQLHAAGRTQHFLRQPILERGSEQCFRTSRAVTCRRSLFSPKN